MYYYDSKKIEEDENESYLKIIEIIENNFNSEVSGIDDFIYIDLVRKNYRMKVSFNEISINEYIFSFYHQKNLLIDL